MGSTCECLSDFPGYEGNCCICLMFVLRDSICILGLKNNFFFFLFHRAIGSFSVCSCRVSPFANTCSTANVQQYCCNWPLCITAQAWRRFPGLKAKKFDMRLAWSRARNSCMKSVSLRVRINERLYTLNYTN